MMQDESSNSEEDERSMEDDDSFSYHEYEENELFRAVKANDHSRVQSLLLNQADEAVDVNCSDWIGLCTPLTLACSKNYLEVAQLLLRHGADVHFQSSSCETALHTAACNNFLQIANALIENGANINQGRNDGFTPLHIASSEGHSNMARLLIQKEANLDIKCNAGKTPLHWACVKGHLPIVRVLAENGANFDMKDNDGVLPIHWVCWEGHLPILQYFIGRDSNLNAKCSLGSTPLHRASLNGNLPIVRALTEHGADWNARTINGDTPLVSAVKGGQMEVLKFAMENCAEAIRITDSYRDTLHYWALEYGHLDVATFLGEGENGTIVIGSDGILTTQTRTQVSNVKLLDGREVDLATEDGANAVLQFGSVDPVYNLSDAVIAMSEWTNRPLDDNLMKGFERFNATVYIVSEYGSPDVFREHVESTTVKDWLNFAITQIQQFSKDFNWISTGKLPANLTSLLWSCATMMTQVIPVIQAFQSNFFSVLAELVNARKGAGRSLPCPEICDVVVRIIDNAYTMSTRGREGAFDPCWTAEAAFFMLERTGALTQYIRCVTVAQSPDSWVSLPMMLDFQVCVNFIRKKVKPGTPCGDTVQACINRMDGCPSMHPSVLNKLTTISRFSRSIPRQESGDDGSAVCRNCGKVNNDHQEPLKECKCHQAFYCDKKCQKEDWKSHENTCFAKKSLERLSKNILRVLLAYCDEAYLSIMVQLVEACEQSGLPKKEMLVELNFNNENGIVPAMQFKPQFKISPVKDYISGRLPDWVEEDKRDFWLQEIKKKYRNVQQHEVLFFVNFEGGHACHLIHRHVHATSKETFSEEFFLAFKVYMNNGDDSALSELFNSEEVQYLKVTLSTWGYDEYYWE